MYEFIKNLQSNNTFYFYTGTAALYALLGALKVGPDDEIILQSFTCPAVPYPVVRLGATPVYVDIDPATFNLDPDLVEQSITPKTKVLIVQHTFGIPADMTRFSDIARRHNLYLIEDACHAFGSKYYDQEVGTFGDAAFYSFGWHKPLVLGVGGAAVVHNPDLKAKLGQLYSTNYVTPSFKELPYLYARYFAYKYLYTPATFWTMKEIYRILRDRNKPKVSTSPPPTNGVVELPVVKIEPNRGPITGKRIMPLQEQRLIKRLATFDKTISHLKWVANEYMVSLSQAGFSPLSFDRELDIIHYKYPLLFEPELKTQIFTRSREERLELSDMFGSPLYPPAREANWKALGYRKGMCPQAETVSDQIVALPVHSKVHRKDIDKTVNLLKSYR